MPRLRTSSLALCVCALATLPVAASPDRPEEREHRREWKEEQKEDRRYWKEHDQREKRYWQEQHREGRGHNPHRYEEERGHGGRHLAPPWMNGYWRAEERRRYVALVPGDPTRMYVFLDGRWVLRQVRDPRARLDLEGAFRLPMAPPPIAPPRIGLDLHVVLFN